MNDKFVKLMQSMSQGKQQANLGTDDNTAARLEKERQLAMIDEKIAQLEQSNDPNALESLTFWQSQRAKIAGN